MSDRDIWKLAGHDVPEDDGYAPCRLCGRTGAIRMLECPKRPDPPETEGTIGGKVSAKQFNVKAGTVVFIEGVPVKLLADATVETAYAPPARVLVGFVPPPGPPAPPDVRHLHNPVA